METCCRYLPYEKTKAFSKLANDYVCADDKLRPFYRHQVSADGVKAAIEARRQFTTNRTLLVQELKAQYEGYELTEQQQQNIEALLSADTFTVTTAHQPNIFTGHLYFIYKILHVIKLAAEWKKAIPACHFVPVYYMGSEDADLEELGHIFIGEERLDWQTAQTGAVGRMNTQGLEAIIQRLEGEFGDLPFGAQMAALCRKAYLGHSNMQQATLYMVNELFKAYGLLVLIPDNARLKASFSEVVKKELLEQFSHTQVEATTRLLEQHYKVQASGRELNLFYLGDDGRRERIERKGDRYYVNVLGLAFTREEILKELEQHPERFSANVILRGLFQETILPNIAFVGGGGELAYWLELKKVFEAVQVPYPMLILRNSFLLLDAKSKQLQQKLGLSTEELFWTEQDTMNLLTQRMSASKLSTTAEQHELYQLYEKLQRLASEVDSTLQPHVSALHARSLKGLQQLEKKMLRAERRKYVEQEGQLQQLKHRIAPAGRLQERVDNFMPWFARYGYALIDELYKHSLTLEQEFGVLEIKE